MNRSAGGSAWFLAGGSIHRFDGTSWSVQRIEGWRNTEWDIGLAVSLDGQVAVAGNYQSSKLWIYNAGQWKQFPIPPAKLSVVPAIKGPRRGRLGVSSESYRGLAIGPGPAIWVAEGGHLRRFSPDGEELMTPPAGLTIGRVSALLQDEAGRVFVTAAAIDQGAGAPEPGLAVFTPDGKATVLSGKQFAEGWRPYHGGDVPPILTPSGKQVWVPCCGLDEPSRLLDLEKKQFVDALPNDRCTCILAVADDGKVFCAERNPYQFGGGAVSVYTPGAAASHAALKVHHFPGRDLHLAVGEDGLIWANRKEEGLACFDGRQWRPAGDVRDGRLTAFLPGHAGAMLACGREIANLYEGTKTVASDRIGELIEKHTAVLRKAFASQPVVHASLDYERDCDLAVDAAGNIWWRGVNRHLAVWTGQRWLNADEPLTAAGASTDKTRCLWPVGDGSKVYLSDMMAPVRQDRSFLGECQNGSLQFTRAPNSLRDLSRGFPCVRDREGAVWIPTDPAETFAEGYPLSTTRVQPTGSIERIRDTGWPGLVDESGGVWLIAAGSRRSEQDTVWIWRRGAIVQTLRIPGRTEADRLFSDRPGSVYSWTSGGLVHLMADPPEFAKYRIAAEYPVPEVRGTIRGVACSPQGCLAVTTYTGSMQHAYHIYLLEIPQP